MKGIIRNLITPLESMFLDSHHPNFSHDVFLNKVRNTQSPLSQGKL